MLIAIVAACMSTGDGSILAMGTCFSHNILRRFAPFEQSKLLRITRAHPPLRSHCHGHHCTRSTPPPDSRRLAPRDLPPSLALRAATSTDALCMASVPPVQASRRSSGLPSPSACLREQARLDMSSLIHMS
jgi:hypothetical protein